MVHYRRNLVPGGTYFFTVTLRDRRSDALVRHIDVLRTALLAVRERSPFRVVAMAVMPDHLHAVWTLPPGDADYAGRWRAVKAALVRGAGRAGLPVERNAKGEAAIWQRRFWEHTIRDAADLATHCDYIHYNPVRHGLVARPAEWPHSTIHRFIASGIYPTDWATSGSPDGAQRNPGAFGERT